MKKNIISLIAIIIILIAGGCDRKGKNLEDAYKLVEEQGDKIEVATTLVSDTIMVDSLDSRQMEQLEACLQYLKGMHDQLEPETREKLDNVIQDKIMNNLDTKGTIVGGEVIDNPDSETSFGEEEE